MVLHLSPASPAASTAQAPSAVLRPGHPFSRSELECMRLDGLLVNVYGSGFALPWDQITPRHRAAAAFFSLPEQVRRKVVLGRLTAAWVYGCAPEPEKLSVLLDHRHRAISQGRYRPAMIHEVTLGPLDTVTIGGVPVSTPLRTALDVALHAPEQDAVRVLSALAGSKGLDCQLDVIRQAIEARPRLPGKARALQRIGAAMSAGP
ncbi:type IV toxin-antitoxin system AbiEi family antitoxin [Arthrobacter sulfonylureivorans]|uniref:Type IV toxin-antitoxin system AbiEi family antitoxin n=1 Tax=Arthrobacter sulfonylureivorans TaxID=2486855 RepID=A0ABY3W4J9_9MICC|nr:type IV toxin-antitoxin system AbiEi family antitoxin [Arthrobacter sulfonylureivorans]UNK44321.1 type IV toxin-antitoxin system AbiEi family antitoxin [Arthrobacter sulfonylureivorans]